MRGLSGNESKKEMIRVIRTSEREFLLDATGKKNGRGAYLCPARECLEKARKMQRPGAFIRPVDSARSI